MSLAEIKTAQAALKERAFLFSLACHGIELEFQPAGGGDPRSIVGEVRDTLDETFDGQTVGSRTVYRVAISTDAEATSGDVAIGGVATLAKGDRFRQPDGSWLVYTGQIERSTPWSWHLICHGHAVERIGVAQTSADHVPMSNVRS